MRLFLLSLLVVLGVSAGASASASATEFFNKGGALILGVLSVESSGGTQTLTGTAGGITIVIVCQDTQGQGTIQNLNGMGLGLMLFLRLGCTVSKPEGSNCLVTGGVIHFPHLHLLAIGTAATPLVEFKSGLNTVLATARIDGCTGAFALLNGSFNYTGALVASANNTTGRLEFNPGAPNNKLVFAGEEASYVGTEKMEMVGGGEIEVK
jgi:hypothetical protein